MSLAVVGQIEQSLRDLLVEPFVVEGRIQRDRLLDNMLRISSSIWSSAHQTERPKPRASAPRGQFVMSVVNAGLTPAAEKRLRFNGLAGLVERENRRHAREGLSVVQYS